jgi:hypothetical protein
MSDQITLLDGSSWGIPELLTNMLDDSFYYGYLGQAALSSSSVKSINSSVKGHYYKQKYDSNEETAALIMGKMIHTLLLEGRGKFNSLFKPVTATTKTTNVYKEAKILCPEGMTVVLDSEVEACDRIVAALERNKEVVELLKGKQSEVPGIGNLFGLPFRAKADKLGPGSVVDLKTTSDVSGFKFSARKYGYNSQAYIYSQLFGVSYQDFRFIVVDKGSLDIAIVEISEDFYFEGERLVEQAVNTYNEWLAPSAKKDINQFTLKFTL